MHRILFVCLGNICRSPLAEGILRKQGQEAGITVEIDSAGTGDWHVGQLPDPRAIRVGEAHGCKMNMRARQVRPSDFDDFDLVIGMDNSNVRDLKAWKGAQPDKIRLIRSYDPEAKGQDVPDPYYGEFEGFEEVAAMLHKACQGLLATLE